MSIRTIALFTVGLPLICGCRFTEFDGVIASVNETLTMPAEHVLTVTDDLSRLVVFDRRTPDGQIAYSLEVYDTDTGVQLDTYTGLTGTWGVVAVSADPVHTDEFWTLHLNGYRFRWSTDLQIQDTEVPIPPMDADFISRDYIDMEIASDGTVFITTVDRTVGGAGTGWLYRDDGGGWDRVNDIGGGETIYKDSTVSFDEANGEAVLLHGESLYRYRADLTLDRVTPLPHLASGYYADLDTYGGRTVLASIANNGGYGQLHLADNVTGAIEDTFDVNRPEAVALETSSFDPSGTMLYGWYVGTSSDLKYKAERYQIMN